jgi:hypothetical protein
MANMKISGYYWDGKTPWIIYQNKYGHSKMVKRKR